MTNVIPLLSILVSFLALIVAMAALALTIGMKLSTHQIEFKPLITHEPFKEEEEEKENEDFLDRAINLQKKKTRITDPLEDIAATSNF